MRASTRLALGLALLSANCILPRKGMDRLFPSTGFEKGWHREGKPRHFGPDNLYEAIDGEADLYLTYGFREMASLLYHWGSPEDTFFVVDVYRMDGPLNAFGLYSGFRHPEYRFQDIGTEGFESEYGLKFHKGEYLVDVKMGDYSEKCRRAAWIVAKEIARRIPAPERPPELLGLLPEEDRVPHTLRLVKREMLNQGFLPGGLEARYRIGGAEVTAFLVSFDSTAAASKGFAELRNFHAVTGRSVRAELPGEESFAAETAYHGTALFFRKGPWLAGVQDLPDVKTGLPLAEAMHARLPGTPPR
jgi:hypothetical protein